MSFLGWVFFLAEGSTGRCSERGKRISKFRAYVIFEMFFIVKTSCYAQMKVKVSLDCGCWEDAEITSDKIMWGHSLQTFHPGILRKCSSAVRENWLK